MASGSVFKTIRYSAACSNVDSAACYNDTESFSMREFSVKVNSSDTIDIVKMEFLITEHFLTFSLITEYFLTSNLLCSFTAAKSRVLVIFLV